MKVKGVVNMNIITISREFGSGGRELGKRLADLLGYDYYDREIVAAIAGQKGLDENYAAADLSTFLCRDEPVAGDADRTFTGADPCD